MLTLKDCDHFVLLMKLIQGFDLRLHTIYFKSSYDDIIKEINDVMESAFDLVIFIKENEKFIYIFEKICNYKKYLIVNDDK